MGTDQRWIEQTLAHRAGAVPYNFTFSPPARRVLVEHYGTPGLEDKLSFPIRMNGTKTIKPLYADPDQFGATAKDEFGVVWATNPIDRGAPIGPCLREADLASYRFPKAEAAYRFEDLGPWLEREKEHYTVIWIGDLWERATFMRGMENILLDLAETPRFVDALLRGLADYILGTLQILCARFQFDCVAVSDDYGTQRGLLMSPAAWRRHIKPLLKEIYTFAQRHNRRVFHHTCGQVEPIIPDLIELGLDILHPIQPEALDVFKLKREFGRDLTLCGGIRTQDLLPYGSPEAVREEVRRLKSALGAGGGYILEPGITLQADVPLANLVAMLEEARA